jgi:thiol-disulfide isomerase/thioredoxin
MTTDRKPVSSSEFADHPATVLNFVAPNCPYCKKQIPLVEALRVEYENKGVRFVNVGQRMGKLFSDAEALAVMQSVGSHVEYAPDAGNRVGSMFQVPSLPTVFVIDSTGTIRSEVGGAKKDLVSRLKPHLDSLLTERPGAGAR